MKLTGRIAAAVAVVSMAVIGGWACSDGGGELSLDKYFEELQALDQRFEEQGAEADAAFESEDLDEIKDAFSDATKAADDFVSDIGDLDPPAEAQEAHDEAVAAGRDLVSELDDVSDLVQGAESPDDLFAALADDAFGEASDRFTAACFELQGIADENNIDVTLNCG